MLAAMWNEPLLQLELPGIKKLKSGKVREVFDLGEAFLLVATDRISAFDCIMPNGIPRKGEVLTQLSHFWFERFASLIPNHLLARADDPLPRQLQPFAAQLARRSMVVKKAKPLAIECVVRGYLTGSGWKEYREGQAVGISFEQAARITGADLAEQARAASLKIYSEARAYAGERGILIADTKFEFGLFDGKLILIDEVLTPDSSRFWPAAEYRPGRSQPSFDKQFVRDYLETLAWSKTPPAPPLPPEVVAKTQAKYLEAYERLTGRPLGD